MIKIEIKGNYIFVEDLTTGELKSTAKSRCEFQKNADGSYDVVFDDKILFDNKQASFFKDENDVVYTAETLETFYTTNTAFSPASSESIADLTQNLSDLQNDVDNKVDKISGKGLSETDFTSIEKSKLASITEIFTTALKNAYDGSVNWISTNGSSILNHIASLSNPHSVTKSQVGLGNVENSDTTTTQNITDSANKRFVSDLDLTKLSNTTGVNSGDETTGSIQTKRPLKTINLTSLEGSGNFNIFEGYDLRKYNLVKVLYLNTLAIDSAFSNLVSGAGSSFGMETAQNTTFQIGNSGSFTKSVLNSSIGFLINKGDITYSTQADLRSLDTDFVIRIGMLGGSFTNSDINQGAHFKYDKTISNNWLLVSGNNTTATVIDSGVLHVNNTFPITKFRIEYNQVANNLTFYINDVSVGIITTNITTIFGCGISVFRILNNGAKIVLTANYQQMVQKLNTER